MAFLAVRIVSRRRLLHLFQVPGLAIVAVVFAIAGTSSLTMLQWGIFLYGITTIGQFSFGATICRAVSDSHARHGRKLRRQRGRPHDRPSAALLTTQLANSMPGASAPAKLAYASAIVGTGAYLIG